MCKSKEKLKYINVEDNGELPTNLSKGQYCESRHVYAFVDAYLIMFVKFEFFLKIL